MGFGTGFATFNESEEYPYLWNLARYQLVLVKKEVKT